MYLLLTGKGYGGWWWCLLVCSMNVCTIVIMCMIDLFVVLCYYFTGFRELVAYERLILRVVLCLVCGLF